MADTNEKKKGGFFAPFKSLAKYLREARAESKKVVWPTRKQIINNTITVIIVVIICGIIIFGLDTVFSTVLRFLLGLSA